MRLFRDLRLRLDYGETCKQPYLNARILSAIAFDTY